MPTIALGGDAMLGRGIARALAEREPASIWSPELLEVFGEADIAIVNLECAISDRGEPWDPLGKPFHFRAPPRSVESLAAAGIRAVWLANNHVLDFGPTALLDTFRNLERAGIVWVGAGVDLAAARSGRILEVGGTRLGLVAFADHPAGFAATADTAGIAWTPLGGSSAPSWLVDVVIAGPHWGPNMSTSPPRGHRVVAHSLVAAGLSALAGHSAHVFHGIELRDGTPICYDLGGLLDDYAVDPVLRNDLGLLALYRPGERLELVPLKLEFARTTLAAGDDHAWVVNRLTTVSRSFGTTLLQYGDRLTLDLRTAAALAEPGHL